jgi:hypothetical protein
LADVVSATADLDDGQTVDLICQPIFAGRVDGGSEPGAKVGAVLRRYRRKIACDLAQAR